ncbi:MAG: hypothetical protein HRU46_16820 [Verrucomicrobiales bacterium]|nr:hypothetical protein [Verrucomicrobiales bacterium]
MKDSDEVQQLLRLKRYETPGEEYFDSFLNDFKDRQRSELLSRSARSILTERVTVWFDELGSAKWLVPAGAAAAAIGVGVFVNTRRPADNNLPQGLANGDIPSSEETHTRLPPTETFNISLPPRDSRVPSFNEEMIGHSGALPAKWEF